MAHAGPSYLPPRTSPLDPPELFRELRHEEPVSPVVLWNGKRVWLVTRHADACAVLQDRRISADVTHPNFPTLAPSAEASMSRINMARVDDPRHGQLRRTVSPEFTPKQIERFRPTVEKIVDHQLDLMLRMPRPVDFVSAYAMPTPAVVVGHLLGVPKDDLPKFQDWAHRLADFCSASAEEMAGVDQAISEFVAGMVEKRKAHPSDDLLGRLTAQGQLTDEELVNMAAIMLTAGHLTTGNMTALSVLSLLTRPDLFTAIRDYPELVDNAVEELLRYHTVVQHGLRRVVVEDLPLGDQLIPAGEGVLVMLPSANRDEEIFGNPDRLEVHRDARQHLAFGHGPHVCLGKTLARLELQATLRALVNRVPTLRLTVPADQLQFQERMFHYGVRELPVTW